MARGRKALSLDEQLEKITEEIDNMESSLKEMKKAKKELEYQIKQAKLSELQIRPNGIPAHTRELRNFMIEELTKDWSEKRGISLAIIEQGSLPTDILPDVRIQEIIFTPGCHVLAVI